MTASSSTLAAPYQVGILVLPNPSWAQVGLVAEVCQLPTMLEQSWMQITCLHAPGVQVILPNSLPLQPAHSFQTLLVLSNNGPAEPLSAAGSLPTI